VGHLLGFRDALKEGLERRSAVHAPALMGPLAIVCNHVFVEHGLHLVDGLKPCAAALDTEMLVQQRAMQALDDAVGLGPFDPGSPVGDAFQLQEQLVGMLVWAAAEFAPVVGQHRLDHRIVLLEGGEHVIVHQMDGSKWQLVGVQPGPGMAGMAVDGGLEIDLADAF
jgi:hypothetical protein